MKAQQIIVFPHCAGNCHLSQLPVIPAGAKGRNSQQLPGGV
jgi:hypothetical protein